MEPPSFLKASTETKKKKEEKEERKYLLNRVPLFNLRL
jgi:hypothetical protein